MHDCVKGQIIKGVGGYYDVRLEGGCVVRTQARGRIRKQMGKPLAGDYVEVCLQPQQQCDGTKDRILPRKNAFVRPPVANVDQVLVVASVSTPPADLLLVDKLLLAAMRAGVQACVAFSKCDEAESAALATLQRQYRGVGSFCISAKTGEGIEAVRAYLLGRFTAVAGQSGVGKSSLLNALCPDFALDTGALSARIARGKHTTRQAELFALPGGGSVVDTPGFSLLETDLADPLQLKGWYPEFAPYEGACKFMDQCAHDAEPGCAVKQAVACGDIDDARYARYRLLLADMREKWRRQYE